MLFNDQGKDVVRIFTFYSKPYLKKLSESPFYDQNNIR